MAELRNYDENERVLIEKIYQQYAEDLKEEKLSYKAIQFLKKIFSKNEEAPFSGGGYIEEDDAVYIHESVRARVITAPGGKNLIIAKTGIVSADVEADTIYVSGRVEGNIKGKYVFIKGTVLGNIKALNVEILINGNVEGDLETSGLVMHRKGILKGKCDIN